MLGEWLRTARTLSWVRVGSYSDRGVDETVEVGQMHGGVGIGNGLLVAGVTVE